MGPAEGQRRPLVPGGALKDRIHRGGAVCWYLRKHSIPTSSWMIGPADTTIPMATTTNMTTTEGHHHHLHHHQEEDGGAEGPQAVDVLAACRAAEAPLFSQTPFAGPAEQGSAAG